MRWRSEERGSGVRGAAAWWFWCSAAAAVVASGLLVFVVVPASSRYSAEAIEEVAGAEELRGQLARMADAQLDFLLTGDEAAVQHFDAIAAQFRAVTGELAERATATEASTLRRVLEPFGRFVDAQSQVVARHRAGDTGADGELATAAKAARVEADARITDIHDRVVAESRRELSSTHRRSEVLTLVLLALSVASGGAAVVFTRVLRRLGHDRALRADHEQLAEAQRIARLGSWERELDSTTVHWSDELFRILGHEPGAVVPGRDTFLAQVHPDDLARMEATIADLGPESPGFEAVHRIVQPSGEVRWLTTRGEVRPGTPERPAAIMGTSLDVTDRQEALEEVGRAKAVLARRETAMRHRAYHDALTALPNRSQLLEAIEGALVEPTEGGIAVLLLDLDGFKRVNDSLGHAIGDLLLIHVARRLVAIIGVHGEEPGRHWMVARLGGDEFGVLLAGLGQRRVEEVAARMVDAVAAPFTIDGRWISVSTSLGITFAAEGATANELLRDADTAMYAAKDKGRACWVVFDPAMRAAVIEHLTIETELAAAVDAGGLALHYQPVVDPTSGSITHIEALVRWPHPTRGNIAPEVFVAMAEETGLIVRLGEWVLREACRELARHVGRRPDLQVAVNVSARQLRDPGLVGAVFRALGDHGLSPGHLVIEVTESVMMDQGPADLAPLQALRRAGIRIAIDDFGTGYSSLSRLRALPITDLKIDKSFIDEIDADGERAPVVAAVIALGHTLGLRIVAEGVETSFQLSSLVRLGCDRIQGYLFSPPFPPAELSEVLAFSHPYAALVATAEAPDGADLEVMTAVTNAVAGAGDLEATVQPLLVEVARLSGMESAYLTSVDVDGVQKVLVAYNGGQLAIPPGVEVPWKDTLCRRALERGVRVSSDVAADFPEVTAARHLGVQSYAMVPVTTSAGLVVGTLCAASRSSQRVDARALSVMEVFSKVIADVLQQRTGAAARRSLQVVIADDSPSVRRMLRLALDETPGIEIVAEAADGDEAVRVCEDRRPDVLLLDVCMPGFDGLAALSRVAVVSPSTKVVVVSADSEAHREAALAAGAVAVVDKWVVVECLPALVAGLA